MMQLNLINNEKNIVSVIPKRKILIELIRNEEDDIYAAVFNPVTGKEDLIVGNMFLSPFVEVQNSIWNSQDFYFAVSDKISADYQRIYIYKYSSQTRTYDVFYSFDEECRDDEDIMVKVFVLSDSVILIQKEIVVDEMSDDVMGCLRFEQRIVDVSAETEIEIREENIKNNGINVIVPVSPTRIMTKTGYSYIEDSRFISHSEEEALIESVFIHSTSRFIADLTIQSSTIDAELVDSAYYNKHILKPGFQDGYIFYITKEQDEEYSESVFYNIETTERYTCRNDNFDLNDLNINFVINEDPYVKNTALVETRFLNLKTKEFDLSAMGMEFLGFIGRLLIVKHMINKHKTEIQIYHCPDLRLLAREKGEYITGVYRNDRYYIYIQK